MSLISIHGPLGSGKTTFLTWLAMLKSQQQKQRTGEYLPILSNYEIEWPSYQAVLPEMLAEINNPTFVALHEAYSWLEARHSGSSALSTYLSYILFESRKRKIDFGIDDQLLTTIDVRFRLLTDFDVSCKRRRDGFHYLIKSAESIKKCFLSFEQAEYIFTRFDTYKHSDAVDKNLLAKISVDKT
jgi:pantothenate kinase-related protein Tda10